MAAEPKEKFSRFLLPGFTLPLRFEPGVNHGRWKEQVTEGEGGELFRNALDYDERGEISAGMPMTTLREFTMLRLMNQLTEKPGWETKVFDETIAEKWKTEAMSTPGADVTAAMADYVIDELRYKAGIFKKTGAVNVYAGDVVKSDNAVSEDLRQELKALGARLEDVPEAKKDYHPGSGGLVLDLVHPSLFPLVYGRSRILPDRFVPLENCSDKCGEGVTTEVAPEAEKRGFRARWPDPHSRYFQWLPCEVELINEADSSGQGEQDPECKISSYINNLHPHRHQDLYRCIEQIIGRVIPQWNRTLGPLKRDDFEHNLRIIYRDCTYTEYPERPVLEEGETDSDYDERLDTWSEAVERIVDQPEPRKFKAPGNDDEPFDLQKEFGHRGLQVIVKLANIHLTPEKPKYEGGSWHVEGQTNERICATALYYYDSENITESRLAFRQQVETDDPGVNYEQDRHEWLEQVFGCRNRGPPVQDVGDVVCKPGRVITFPNVLQHRVQPFELEDASRAGHRKILALFLVDPNIRVISTANVPPQQRDWWWERVQSAESAINTLPAELQEEVARGVDFPIGMEDAKEIRLQLMEERKNFQYSQNGVFESGGFSLCEH